MISQSFSNQASNNAQMKRSIENTRGSSQTLHASLYRTRSLQRLSEENKAKKVRFYRNGDKFYQGLVYAISKARFRSFEVLLADLTVRLADKANLPQGVRIVFSLDGKKKINSVEDLEPGESYVCASNDGYKKIDYARNINPNWSANVRTTSSSSIRLRQQERSDSWVIDDVKNRSSREVLYKPYEKENRDFVRPKLATFIKNGVKPRKAVRMLLNKKTAHSVEQVFNDVTKVIKLDTGAVRKIYTLKGKQVQCLQDFFEDEDVFIVYGHERPSPEDFFIDSDEAKFIHPIQSSSQPRTPRRSFQRKNSERLNKSGSPEALRCFNRRTYSQRNSTPRRQSISGAYPSPRRMVVDRYPRQVTERYQIGDVIGDGHFAVVRECVERSSAQKFALKIIDKSKCIGKEHMIVNEVSILRRIKHPNVVRLIQEFDTTKDIYLVMELVNGGDLFDAISSASRYTERDASGMLHSLASALAYLHKLHIVHRDIKPENLLGCVSVFVSLGRFLGKDDPTTQPLFSNLLKHAAQFDQRLQQNPKQVYRYDDGSKSLKLADFGLATVVSNPLYSVCGTPTYVAPEIILQTGYGVKVDVWAAGVIAYILLCGFPPFRSETNSQEELFDAILAGDLQFPSRHWENVSESAKSLIRETLNVDQHSRLSAEEILLHTWLSKDVPLNRDIKTSISSKLSNLRPVDKQPSPPTTGRKRRVNTGARVLAMTSLDKSEQLLLSFGSSSATTDDSSRGIPDFDIHFSSDTDSGDVF